MSTERKVSAFLEITMVSKQLLVRQDDVQVLHGFTSLAEAEGYLKSDLFNQDVVVELKPFFQETPDIKIYSVVG